MLVLMRIIMEFPVEPGAVNHGPAKWKNIAMVLMKYVLTRTIMVGGKVYWDIPKAPRLHRRPFRISRPLPVSVQRILP